MAKVITYRQIQHQLAASYNNAANLRPLEGYTPAGDSFAFQTFSSWGNYNPGLAVINGDGTITYDGEASTAWQTGFLTYTQLAYLSDTYCSGGYSGQVTVRTSTTRRNTYANFNAVMHLPPPDPRSKAGFSWKGYVIQFTKLTAI